MSTTLNAPCLNAPWCFQSRTECLAPIDWQSASTRLWAMVRSAIGIPDAGLIGAIHPSRLISILSRMPLSPSNSCLRAQRGRHPEAPVGTRTQENGAPPEWRL